MTLTLHLHPLSSFCMKAVMAFYENGTPFAAHTVNLGDAGELAAHKAMWPLGKIPVLRDDARDRTIPEATIIIEYLAQHYPGKAALIPADPDLARQTCFRDRVFDLYVNVPMQKIVTDRLRPAGKNDAFGVEEARRVLATSLGMIDREMAKQEWAMGTAFSMADCAAAPGLFYANKVAPLAGKFPHAAAYLERLERRPSFARALTEAQPFFKFFPQ